MQSIALKVKSIAHSVFCTIFEKKYTVQSIYTVVQSIAQRENLKKSAISSLSNFLSNFSSFFEICIINSNFGANLAFLKIFINSNLGSNLSLFFEIYIYN